MFAKMKFLVATVTLLVLAVAEASHTPQNTLRGPRFRVGKVHVFEVEFNATSGISGLSNQVSKLVFRAQLHIYAKNEKEHFLKLTDVYTSDSVKSDEHIQLLKNGHLEERLSSPIKFTLENGEVSSYTLSSNENLESRKIKKSILRSLEMYIPESAHVQIESSSSPRVSLPVTYNITQNSERGVHTTYYFITVSPNVEFPYESSVRNVCRSEDFEGERYLSYKYHHNFDYQGCPNVCRCNRVTNEYGPGCPVGYEPHQSPVKTYVHHQHHLALEDGVMTPEIIKTTEVHVAKMYDQDMTVMIVHNIRKIGYSSKTIDEPSGETYTNLNDQESEINDKEIEEFCKYRSSREAANAAKTLLREIAQVIVRADLKDTRSTIIGEKIILLKNALSKLSVSELQTIAGEIKRLGSLATSSEEEKVKRQIWMDILPVIGTESAVTFIVKYIKENVGGELLVWEAKEILEALPQNIHTPSEKNILELRTLLTLPTVKSRHLLHSAVYTCLGRVIGDVCNGTQIESSSSSPVQKPSRKGRRHPRTSEVNGSEECPELVSGIVKEIADKLRSTKRNDEIIIYLETLAHIGVPEVLPLISEFSYGTAENIQDFSPSNYEFVRAASVYTLHGIAKKHPEIVLEIVKPLFFNETETPKLRNAAFGVLVTCQPSLEVLQHVAVRSWSEKSNEVGSFVTSTMETFGNSTLPCMSLTSRRIQQVMPMLKRFDMGIQHAKNLIWDYFDDVREFGVQGHFSYTPSNESIVPSAIYHALSYSTDGLTDALIRSSLHIQGLTQRHIIEYIDQRILGTQQPEAISPSKEQEIFEEAKIVERIPEALKLTIYRKMFYSSAFYYLDINNIKIQIDTLREYLRAYLARTSYDYSGHLVKIYLPSTFHTETIAKTLPYPVEFQMLQPVILALKIESRERNPSLANFHFLVRPSVYLSKLFIHQLKDIGNCKEIGAYHEHKIAFSYPLEVKFVVQGLTNITLSYKVPELPTRILYYFTESGTYAGKKSFETLPSSENRAPIRTLPSPFKYSPEIDIIGVPPVQMDLHVEDIDLAADIMPRSALEALDIAIKRIMNAGWKYNAANITIRDDSRVWPKDTEVTFNVQYNRTHVTKNILKMTSSTNAPWFASRNEDDPESGEWVPEPPESNENDQSQWSTESSPQSWFGRKDRKDENAGDGWYRDLLPFDFSKRIKPSMFTDRARRGSTKLSASSHVTHELKVGIETRPVYSTAYIRAEYNHTHSRSLQLVRVDAAIKRQKDRVAQKISFVHLMGHFEKPDEFHYDSERNDKQRATFITALRSSAAEFPDPWKDVHVVAGGEFHYETLDTKLNSDLLSDVDRKFFLPEEHEKCIQDVKDGHPLSVDCVKAIRERSIYNKLRMAIQWHKNIPDAIKEAARKLDGLFKHAFYNHMIINSKDNYENMLHITLDYINKFTDTPVYDAIIEKPHETIVLRKLRAPKLPVETSLSSIYDILDSNIMELTNNSYPPTCVMMKKYVRTYDLKSYPITLDNCSYVLSAHCSDYKNFAIISKVLSPGDGTKEIHIHIGSHTITLTPKTGKHYTISYNGQDYTVSDSIVFDEDAAEIYVFAESYSSNHKHLQVVATKAGMRVVYDGQNVKVQIDPRYKGETCGLCSEFDGETVREFRGLDRCLYSHPDDFVNSAITNRDKCRKEPVHPYYCESEASNTMVWRRGNSSNEHEPSTKRNAIITKGNEVCFSIYPIPVCEQGDKSIETESRLIGFHCLPKQDSTVRRLISEAKRRSLGEIENKSIDYEENVIVSKLCSA